MDKEAFDKVILNPIADQPQRVGLAQMHLANLHTAVAGLAEMGHRVALSFAAAPTPVEWPKMLYRSSGIGPGNTMEVHSRQHQDNMVAEGWRTHPTAEGEPEPMPQAVEAPPTEHKVDGSVAVNWPKPVPMSGAGQTEHQAGTEKESDHD